MHLAHRFALASPLVSADMVEATEYPHLVQKHRVMGVPKTIINGVTHLGIEGSVPEKILLDRILEATRHGDRGGKTNPRS